MKQILLVEPNYKNKYPPLGLMKICTYHRSKGDEVFFVKGIKKELQDKIWDRIYITSLFTFDYKITIQTIEFYKKAVNHLNDIWVGGIMASLLTERIKEETGISNVIMGLLTNSSILGYNDNVNIDELTPDYDLLDMTDYKYPAGNSYISYTSRGCPNKCDFCAVPKLEPTFHTTNNILDQIKYIDEKYGPKQGLLLLDNNILKSENLHEIVEALCSAGFGKDDTYVECNLFELIVNRYKNGERSIYLDKKIKNYLNNFRKRLEKKPDVLKQYTSLLIEMESAAETDVFAITHYEEINQIIEKYRNKMKKKRYIDFNQGIDARRINDTNMELLSMLAIKPLRIAFDDIKQEHIYKRAVRIAHKHGIKQVSNYILFNHKDRPEDLYNRLVCNIKLNDELGINIFSFPMKYSPVSRIDRSHIGTHWNKKYLNAISAILHVTKGIVAAGGSFFYKAFGQDLDEFFDILAMPREMIMYRFHFEGTGQTEEWKRLYHNLSSAQKKELLGYISMDTQEMIKEMSSANKIYRQLLEYYLLKYSREYTKI